ncbi:MAG: RluA family pseudouridine synthase [Chitinispirillales bacterium]|jgi:23S rRNA pseudouridine1911/1915/1917 synthase|nr:RluA family pseudouridine synthase [Chitinispirillales bacterium]
MKISSKIPLTFNGFSLIDYLATRFTYLEREIWKERILESRFIRNEKVLHEKSIIFHKDIIVYDMPDIDEPEANFNYKIIKRTDNFLAIDKPFGLMVHKHGINFRNNLIYHLRELHEPPFPTADIVNRLDKNTSGIVLISLNKNALKELLRQFADRSVKKTYFAVVLGTPNPLYGEISVPIAKIMKNAENNNNNGRFCEVNLHDGKPCQTFYETIKSANGHSLVKLFPKTGRTHQLRIHLAHISVPIVGDTAYGLSMEEYINFCKKNDIIPIETNRHLLHCANLEFSLFGEKISVDSDLPEEFVKNRYLFSDF